MNNYCTSGHWMWYDYTHEEGKRPVGYNHLISNKCKWNNCFIENAHKISRILLDFICKTTNFQLVFNFDQMHTVTIIIWRVWYNGSYTMIWWLSQSELWNCIIQWFWQFLIMAITPSYPLWNLRNYLLMWKALLPAKRALNQTLQRTKMKFEKLLGSQVLKNTTALDPF